METAASGIRVSLIRCQDHPPANSFAVTFRLVVFRPFVSEVIVATVKESAEDYVRGRCLVRTHRLTGLSPVQFPQDSSTISSFRQYSCLSLMLSECIYSR